MGEPTLIMTTVPMRGIIVSDYVSFTHVCCTLVPEIRACPEVLCVFRYIDVLTCVVYNYMHSTEQHEGDMSYSYLP